MVVADPTTDVFNPNVVRASLGSLFTVPLAVADGDEALGWLREMGLRVIATSPAAAEPCWKADLSGGAAVVIGAEQHGLSGRWLEGADQTVRISHVRHGGLSQCRLGGGGVAVRSPPSAIGELAGRARLPGTA